MKVQIHSSVSTSLLSQNKSDIFCVLYQHHISTFSDSVICLQSYEHIRNVYCIVLYCISISLTAKDFNY